jgi:hypothetical protein
LVSLWMASQSRSRQSFCPNGTWAFLYFASTIMNSRLENSRIASMSVGDMAPHLRPEKSLS